MAKPSFRLLDQTLQLVNDNPKEDSREIAKKLTELQKDVTYDDLFRFLQKLDRDKYINKTTIVNNWSYTISVDGELFLEQGGYRAELKRKSRQEIWIVVKIIAGVLNALLALGVGFYAAFK